MSYDAYCHCHTCNKTMHSMGIARHRAMHRDKHEDCTITYSGGDTYTSEFSKHKHRVQLNEEHADSMRARLKLGKLP